MRRAFFLFIVVVLITQQDLVVADSAIGVSPRSLSFSGVFVGRAWSWLLTIRCVGAGCLVLDNVSVEGGGAPSP